MKFTLQQPASFEKEIKGSRFLALAAHAANADEAMQWLSSVHVPDATHNCWAYRIGDEYRSSDDGEPAGSAGRPILAAIDGQEMDQVACIVVRWYGGTKLGVGGLLRAYGGTAAECLRTATTVPIVNRVQLACRIAFDEIGITHKYLHDYRAQDVHEEWTPAGLTLDFTVECDDMQNLQTDLNDATRGQIVWITE